MWCDGREVGSGGETEGQNRGLGQPDGPESNDPNDLRYFSVITSHHLTQADKPDRSEDFSLSGLKFYKPAAGLTLFSTNTFDYLTRHTFFWEAPGDLRYFHLVSIPHHLKLIKSFKEESNMSTKSLTHQHKHHETIYTLHNVYRITHTLYCIFYRIQRVTSR